MNGEYRIGDVVLGNWTLVKLLGEGAYGKVYEAHREDFGTTYTAAIKVMTIPQSQSEVESARAEGMDDESVTSYFRSFVEEVVQEFALMSELKGTANVVSYEDHSVTPHTEGIGWDILIRMELLTPMLKHMTSHEMTRSDIIKLGIDMCKALELCQRYNIIHRDIKPENIFVSRTGDYKLGDFGVARTLEKTTGGLSKKGTYTYMAPEIYKDEKYGSTVDIYSLGIVLYRLLNNNRAPFLPEPPKPITHSERERALVRRISGEKLPPPANADGRLAEIVLKACAYDPKDRYSSPLLMRQELEAIQYHKADDEVIYGRNGKIDVDSRDYTKMGDDERTVYESRKPAPVPTDGDEDDEKTVYQAHQTNAEIPTATKDTKKGNKTGLIIGIPPLLSLLYLHFSYFQNSAKDRLSLLTGRRRSAPFPMMGLRSTIVSENRIRLLRRSTDMLSSWQRTITRRFYCMRTGRLRHLSTKMTGARAGLSPGVMSAALLLVSIGPLAFKMTDMYWSAPLRILQSIATWLLKSRSGRIL